MGKAFGCAAAERECDHGFGLGGIRGMGMRLGIRFVGGMARTGGEHEYDRRCQRSAQCLNQQWFHFQTTFIDGFLVWNILSAEWRETRHGMRSVVFLSARLQYSGLNLNQDKVRQRRTGLKLIHYKVAENLLPAWS